MERKSVASTVLMIRPHNFAFNIETSQDNSFQKSGIENITDINHKANEEFSAMVTKLENHKINVLVVEDLDDPKLPDAVFPNNWIANLPDNTLYTFPMKCLSRRKEFRKDIVELLTSTYAIDKYINLNYLEQENVSLEGTGSLILDHNYKKGYACFSQRTDIKGIEIFESISNYKIVAFEGISKSGAACYHTNVIMCIGESFAIICLDYIIDKLKKEEIIESLTSSKKEIIDITIEQVDSFCGNMLELKNTEGLLYLCMSSTAYNSLTEDQLNKILKHSKILTFSVPTIESIGGGSVRCMMAEIFSDKKQNEDSE